MMRMIAEWRIGKLEKERLRIDNRLRAEKMRRNGISQKKRVGLQFSSEARELCRVNIRALNAELSRIIDKIEFWRSYARM